jgi:membrane fusion protein (multidrug efflux system)
MSPLNQDSGSVDSATTAPSPTTTPAATAQRKKLFAALGAVLALGAAGYGGYQALVASRYVSTDNAYTAVETAQVTPAVGGIVREVTVADTSRSAAATSSCGSTPPTPSWR